MVFAGQIPTTYVSRPFSAMPGKSQLPVTSMKRLFHSSRLLLGLCSANRALQIVMAVNLPAGRRHHGRNRHYRQTKLATGLLLVR